MLFFHIFLEKKDQWSKRNVQLGNSSAVAVKNQPTATRHTPMKSEACSFYGEMAELNLSTKAPSYFSDWSYKNRLVCPDLNLKQMQKTRKKLLLTCSKDQVFVNLVETNATDEVHQVRPDDKCLSMYIGQCCSDAFPVPNVVHYVWYNKKRLSFFEFVSFVSTIRFVRPCAILIHGDSLPEGIYWNFIKSLYPNIVHVVRKVPELLFGKEIRYVEHIADAWKISSLISFGGIYMDTDMLLVKPIEPFRHNPCTLARHAENSTISPGFIMAERNASFLQEWLHWYKFYYVNDSFTYNSMTYPQLLSLRIPEDVYVADGMMSRPNGQVGDVIYMTNTDWSGIFGMQLHSKLYIGKVGLIDESNVRIYNTTVGALCRHILFGNKELCAVGTTTAQRKINVQKSSVPLKRKLDALP